MGKDVFYAISSEYSSCKSSKERYKPALREQLEDRGAESLSDCELITVLLGSGTKAMPVKKLAFHVLKSLKISEDGKLGQKLKEIKGMGTGKASTILAALELGRRFHGNGTVKITKPQDLLSMVQHYALTSQEHFLCISLNGANELIKIRTVSVGTLNRAITHPREVYSDPLKDRAAAVILVHNHPSGSIKPSDDDVETTIRMQEASKILGIHLLDHIIITKNNYYSFMENSLVLG